jgi:hypothetical protein
VGFLALSFGVLSHRTVTRNATYVAYQSPGLSPLAYFVLDDLEAPFLSHGVIASLASFWALQAVSNQTYQTEKGMAAPSILGAFRDNLAVAASFAWYVRSCIVSSCFALHAR